jgi:hypothetical protein
MEVDIPHGGHGHALGLEGPPFAPDHPDLRIVDRVSEDRTGDFDLAGREWARIVYVSQPLILSSH